MPACPGQIAKGEATPISTVAKEWLKTKAHINGSSLSTYKKALAVLQERFQTVEEVTHRDTPPQLHVARKPADQTRSRDPKAGVAHRPDGHNYVRHKLGVSQRETPVNRMGRVPQVLDNVGS